jgi:hypothetical protein
MTQSEFFGVCLRDKGLRTGLLIGVLLSTVLIAWLCIANRMPRLEPYAAARNISGGILATILLAVPVVRFRREPASMFISGLAAWTLLTAMYIAMEWHFSLLESRMGALQVFMLGAISYSFVSVFQWVYQLCAEARHRYIERSTISGPTARRTP